jgi:glycosyltransferase involved in cell wall biosynthesis
VDDGSTTAFPQTLSQLNLSSIESIDVLSLRRNLGHQRAIAVGLAFLGAKHPSDVVVVMDSDGQDNPHDVPYLVKQALAHENKKIIFAARVRRMEHLTFRIFYHLYRWVHLFLTGIPVRVGNFSVIPWGALERIVAVSELWNHYAAAVYKARLPLALVPTQRSQRLEGPSRMNFVALVVHGLSAMAVFGDRIGVRLLILVVSGMGCAGVALMILFAIRMWTTLLVPDWVTYASIVLLLLTLQMVPVLLVFVFMILASRDTASMIPSRDYVHFTAGVHRVHENRG